MSNIYKNITDKKQAINILILGPYGKCQTKLLRLRDYLRSRGYENTKLVIDFADNGQQVRDVDIYFLEKSKEHIKNWADILLFVFDQECNNDSVLVELCYMIENINEKSSYSAIISSSERYIGSLLRGTIKLNHIRFREFSTMEELEKKGYSAVFNITQEIEATRWHFSPQNHKGGRGGVTHQSRIQPHLQKINPITAYFHVKSVQKRTPRNNTPSHQLTQENFSQSTH